MEQKLVEKFILYFLGYLHKDIEILIQVQGLIPVIFPFVLEKPFNTIAQFRIKRNIIIEFFTYTKKLLELFSLLQNNVKLLHLAQHLNEFGHAI